MLPALTIKRLTLARYLYMLATDQGRLNRDAAAFACINMMHDAVEIFLVAIANHVNAQVQTRTDFSQYLDRINDRIRPRELPFRQRLIELNKVRVAAKHDGVRPDSTELGGYIAMAREFLEQASLEVFAVNFWTISLVDLIENEVVRSHLVEAEHNYQDGRFFDTMVSCRKAFYCLYEQLCDIRKYISDGEGHNALARWFCRAPAYATTPEYLNRVTNPFEYIVLDHSRIDSELANEGIDYGAFWNVWRLTPSVYQMPDSRWLVKIEPETSSPNADGAAYVLDNMTAIALRKQAYEKSQKYNAFSPGWTLSLKGTSPVNLYQKAQIGSLVSNVIPEHIRQIKVRYGTAGLTGEGYFWSVLDNFGDVESGIFISGYLDDRDVLRE